uniref:Putative tick transposon n=1 Tax=Rhipicephalus pulchellus TaxID=72859 RepID=L7LY34_RHIPC
MFLYHALFVPVLNYGLLVWATTTKENTDKLAVLQKRVVRLACKVSYLSHTSDLFIGHNIVLVKSIFNYNLCRQHKSSLMKKTGTLQTLAGLQATLTKYNTRKPEDWQIKKCCTNYGKQMLQFTLPALLNRISKEQLFNITETSFKELCRQFTRVSLP